MLKKYVWIIVLTGLLMIGVPLILGLLSGKSGDGPAKGEAKPQGAVEVPKTVKVWVEQEGKVRKMDFEEYVTCVTASEMPSSFDEEALKAQSVAARTYTMAKIIKYEEKRPEAHPDAPICSSTHCQAYKSEKELIACHEEGWEKEGFEKVKKACKETEGQLLYYDGELVMQPLFFSSSGGQTENSEDVFVGAYPYLVSVSSPYEEGARHENEEKIFGAYEIKQRMESKYPDRQTGNLGADSFKVLSRTAGGRVNEMQIGQSKYKGTEVRNALGLSSALFSISIKTTEDGSAKVVFTSDGFGHGVGLSQYGADGMAKKGKDHREILTHYYTGTQVY